MAALNTAVLGLLARWLYPLGSGANCNSYYKCYYRKNASQHCYLTHEGEIQQVRAEISNPSPNSSQRQNAGFGNPAAGGRPITHALKSRDRLVKEVLGT